MATDDEAPRSALARELAEEALLRLVRAVGDRGAELVVVGGLVPARLTTVSPAVHIGTTDVDIVVDLALVWDRDEQDFGWLERGLREAGFDEDLRSGGGWRWRTTIEGWSVKVELLCDLRLDPSWGPHPLPGCARASAINLPGPAAARRDAVMLPVRGRSTDPAELRSVRHAGLGGYLVAKASAVVRRGEARDRYDFAFVLIHNDDGGPTAASEAVARLGSDVVDHDVRTCLDAAIALFVDADRPGAREYASGMTAAGDPTEEAVLLEDATSAALEFRAHLEVLLPRLR
ncbi:MAG: hypothetical protein U0Q15_01020 [Kineosporiaceae bacterium]